MHSAREVDIPSFLVRLWDRHIESWPYDCPFSAAGGSDVEARQLRADPAVEPQDGRKAIERKRGYAGQETWAPILPGFTMRGARHTADMWMKEDCVDRARRVCRSPGPACPHPREALVHMDRMPGRHRR
ncbi:hypothetical protein GCM10020000_56850 [Streptomyces olivoverticillatus]